MGASGIEAVTIPCDRGQGNFTAAFAGRHGWWWYNRGQEPVTVTLATQGEYTILGVV